MTSTAHDYYRLDEIAWGKVKGYPWWPCMVYFSLY